MDQITKQKPLNVTTETPTTGPLRIFRAGSVNASVWVNEKVGKDGQTYSLYSVKVERNYKHAATGAWRSTSTFNADDIARALLVLQEAQRFLLLTEERRR